MNPPRQLLAQLIRNAFCSATVRGASRENVEKETHVLLNLVY